MKKNRLNKVLRTLIRQKFKNIDEFVNAYNRRQDDSSKHFNITTMNTKLTRESFSAKFLVDILDVLIEDPLENIIANNFHNKENVTKVHNYLNSEEFFLMDKSIFSIEDLIYIVDGGNYIVCESVSDVMKKDEKYVFSVNDEIVVDEFIKMKDEKYIFKDNMFNKSFIDKICIGRYLYKIEVVK